MMLSNRNMQTSVLDINKEGTITFLNKLPYLSDSEHLKIRKVHIMTESIMTES